jgi:TyrR family helix-turn-helix protein
MVDVSDVILALAEDNEQKPIPPAAVGEDGAAESMNKKTEHNKSSLKEFLSEAEESILREYKRRYHSTRQIAEALNISQSSVVRKLQQYGLNSV